MPDASTPQNDRELLLKLNSEIERLAVSISEFSRTLQNIEEKKIAGLDERLKKVEGVWQQVAGGWKLALVIWSIITAAGLFGIFRQWMVK